MFDHPALPTKTGWVIIGLMGVGVWWGYTAIVGDADGKIHIYNSDIKQAEINIVRTETGEVLKKYSLKRNENKTFVTNESGDYEVQIPSHNKKYNVHVEKREYDSFKEPLINIGADREIYLEPVFYVSQYLSAGEQKRRVKELSKKYRSYEYEKDFIDLPIPVDYGFGESIPLQKGGSIFARPKRKFSFFSGSSADDEQEAFYYLGDSARRTKVNRWLN